MRKSSVDPSVQKVTPRVVKQFKTGLDFLDDDHRQFIQLSRLIVEAKVSDQFDAQMADVLMQLDQYLDTHCADEEREMMDSGHPEFEEHKKKHEKFRRKIKKMIEKYHRGDTLVLQDLPGLVLTWFRAHIVMDDTPYRTWLTKNQL